MNNDRRKSINEIKEKLGNIQNEIEGLRDDEQEYKDNMPEYLQDGEKGQLADQAIEELDNAYNAMDEVISHLKTAAE